MAKMMESGPEQFVELHQNSVLYIRVQRITKSGHRRRRRSGSSGDRRTNNFSSYKASWKL